MSRWIDYLIHLAIQKLAGVVDVVNRQVDRLQAEIVEDITSTILGPLDEYWRGDSATQFAEETQQMVSELTEAMSSTRNTCQALESARDTMVRADQQAQGLVSDLENVYQKIVQ